MLYTVPGSPLLDFCPPGSPISSLSGSEGDWLNFSSPESDQWLETSPAPDSPSPPPSPTSSTSEAASASPKPCVVCHSDQAKQNYARHMRKHRPLVLSEDCVCEACERCFWEVRSCKRHIEEGRCRKMSPFDIPGILDKRKAASEAKKLKESQGSGKRRRSRATKSGTQAKGKKGAKAQKAAQAVSSVADFSASTAPIEFHGSNPFPEYPSLEMSSPESSNPDSGTETSDVESEMHQYVNFDYCGEETTPSMLMETSQEEQPIIDMMSITPEQFEEIIGTILQQQVIPAVDSPTGCIDPSLY